MKNIFNKIKYFFEKRKLFNKVTLEQSNFVVLDTETTGLYSNKGDKIVSIAALKINNFEVDKQNYLNRLINPGIEIPLSSTQIHGINNEDIKQEPRLVDINKEIFLFLKKSILVGHNIDFDIGFIKNDAKGTDLARRMSVIQPIDTIFLTAGLFPDLKNYQLDNLCSYFDIKTDDQIRHSALGDCEITSRLFLLLLKEAKKRGINNISGLIKLCEQGKNLHYLIKNSKNIH